MTEESLVSVGIPCYNRPETLRRTLECITGQTYTNLEIIISDNCSPDPEVERIGRRFANKDARVQYYRQSINKGGKFNFQFVLEKATGEYFMWAADDDLWITSFIKELVNELRKKGSQYVAAMMECQYFEENQLLDFFEEGSPFYKFYSESKLSRLYFMLNHNYGNLYYSIFRRSALYDENESILNKNPTKSSNEISLFLFVIENGNWVVKPKIGMYKKTNLNTYHQARWEMNGGKLSNVKITQYLLSLINAFRYHILAARDIVTTIAKLNLSYYERSQLTLFAAGGLIQHYYHLVIRRK